AIGILNRVGERQNLIVIAVVVLQDNIDKYFVALPRDDDRLWMEHLFVFAELFDEFFDAMLVEERFSFRRIASLVGEIDLQTRVEKGQLAQARGQPLELKFRRDREDGWIGQKSN